MKGLALVLFALTGATCVYYALQEAPPTPDRLLLVVVGAVVAYLVVIEWKRCER